MIQAPAVTDIVETIVARLVSELHPRRIYLFGSRARGDARADSDYDFMVELDHPVRDRRAEGHRVGSLFVGSGAEIQVHLRNPGQLERRKDDPGTVDWDVVREGRLLFALPGVSPLYPAARGGRVSESKRVPPNSLQDWIGRAEEDLRVAAHLSADFAAWPNTVCFHCQQSAEKFLKALIIAQHERPARTHDLGELLEHLRTLGFTLGDVDADCVLLSKFAVRTRYPDDSNDETGDMERIFIAQPIVFSEEDARHALPALNRIVAAVRAHLP